MVPIYDMYISGQKTPYLKKIGSVCAAEDLDISSTSQMAELARNVFSADQLAEERIWMASFGPGSRNTPVGLFEVTRGTPNTCIVRIDQIMRRALLSGANAIALIHNHPSGYIEPSNDDFEITGRIKNACDLLGINFLDHLIIGREENYYSFAEHNQILEEKQE